MGFLYYLYMSIWVYTFTKFFKSPSIYLNLSLYCNSVLNSRHIRTMVHFDTYFPTIFCRFFQSDLNQETMLVHYVQKWWKNTIIWMCIFDRILEKNLLNVCIVNTELVQRVIWKHIWIISIVIQPPQINFHFCVVLY